MPNIGRIHSNIELMNNRAVLLMYVYNILFKTVIELCEFECFWNAFENYVN